VSGASFLLSWAITVPTGFVVLVLIAGHLGALARVEGMDPIRQRIRQVNGIVMFLLVPLIVFGLSIVDWQRRPMEWVIIWAICTVLVVTMVMMATLDAINTARLSRERRAELRAWLHGNKEHAPPLPPVSPGHADE